MEYCIFVDPQVGASYDDQLAVARAAERLGYTGFFRSDHFMTFAGDGLPGPTDAWTVLAGLARDTERVRLGTLVTSATFRYAGILAIQVATVDAMSGGRAELGIGAGWFEAEHKAYGVPYPVRRFDLLDETLAVITGLWGTPVGETFDFAGEHYTLTGSPALPKPVQPRLPIIVGGTGPRRVPELAVRYATEYNFHSSDDPSERFAAIDAVAEAAGRDPRDLRHSVLFVAEGTETDTELVDRFARLAEVGCDRVYLMLGARGDLDQIERYATEVIPKVR